MAIRGEERCVNIKMIFSVSLQNPISFCCPLWYRVKLPRFPSPDVNHCVELKIAACLNLSMRSSKKC